MATMRALSYLIVCIRVSYGWWPFSDGKADELGDNKFTTNIRDESHVIGDGKVVVPFEMKSVEQKFLQESKQLLELSPLEDCQHKVSSIASSINGVYSLNNRLYLLFVKLVEN